MKGGHSELIQCSDDGCDAEIVKFISLPRAKK